MNRLASSAGILLITAAAAFAQQPRLGNAQLRSETVNGSLDRTMKDRMARASAPEWIGYAVPSANPESNMCCWSSGGSTVCQLEPGASNAAAATSGPTAPIRL
jgi:hypothetical protein